MNCLLLNGDDSRRHYAVQCLMVFGLLRWQTEWIQNNIISGLFVLSLSNLRPEITLPVLIIVRHEHICIIYVETQDILNTSSLG